MPLELHNPHSESQNYLYTLTLSLGDPLSLLRRRKLDSGRSQLAANPKRFREEHQPQETGRGCFRMSRNNGKSPKMDLKLNLSLSAMRGNTSRRVADDEEGSPNNSSSPSSCVSSDAANSPEATSMVLAGCPRCLMYVMLAEDDPKCPKCKSTVLLDFLNTTAAAAAATTTTTNNNNNKGKKNRKS